VSLVTLGQAAMIAGISQTEYMHELCRQRIPLHYKREEYTDDLQTIAKLSEQLDHARYQ
jgi:predicted HTH domain antitoxin